MSSLSLLSRGAGQIARKEQEKLEVHFDPEDYLNWTSPETRCHVSKLLGNSQEDIVESWRIGLPKTYSTRTGALILYSEDLAKPSRKWEEHRKSQSRVQTKSQTLQIELHTLQDLARAILAYGGKQIWKDQKGSAWQPYLHFLSDPESWTDREMRPGYSAKRYLLKLSQTLSPSVLQKLRREGYIRDPFLLEESSGDHRQRQQDLSAVPPKYNLLHIYCAPWAYLQAELEEQQTHPGIGPSFHKQAKKRARLLEEGYEGKQNARGMTQIPLRISVRKLSFHFRQLQTKETTWSQNIAYKGIPGNKWAKVHQHQRTIQEDVDHCEIPKQGVENYLENTSIAASELWCEKSGVTFYKGILPGRKIFYSVTQRHLKNADGKEKTPSVDPGLFPPVQTETHSECDGINKKYTKQVPQILHLPQIFEDSPKAPLGETNSNELSKELVILPLLVQMRKKTQSKTKKLKETCCTVSKSVTCAEQLAPLQKDLNFQLEHRSEPQKEISGGLPKAAKDSFCLPPINNGEFTWNGEKTKKKEARASEKASKYQREIHKDTSLSSLLMGPKRETISPSLVGPVQTTDDPRQFGYVPDNEGEDQVLTEGKIASRCPPETTVVDELDEKEAIQLFAIPKNRSSALCADRSLELPQTQQAEKPQRRRNGLGKQQSVMGNESFSIQFGKENQQSHGGLCRNSCLQESKEERGRSVLTQTERLEQRNGADFFAQDTKKPLGNFPRSADLAYLEPHVALPTISEWEMESVTQSNNIIAKLLDHSEEIEESMRMDTWSSERLLETEERVALPEKTSNKAKVIRLNRTGGIIENKQMTKQKKRDSMTTGSLSKAQKKRPKKEHKNQVLVVGKPRQKKATGKTDAPFKEKLGGARRSETSDEPNKVEEKREDAKGEQFSPFVEEGGGGDEEWEERRGGEGEEEVEKDDDGLGSTSDPSCPPSSPPKETDPLLPEESQPVAEDVGFPPHRPPFHLHLITANGSLTTAVQSGGLPEEALAKKEEAKLLRERGIVERAEKRRLTVEKRRREQEELKRKEQDQQERMERIKEEMEQEQQRRIEEMRLRKQQLEEERQREEEETERRRQAEKAAQERIWQQQEEHRRKILEMQKKKQEEEKERAEAEKRRQKERALWLEEERRFLAEMAEEERVEYEKKKREEEAKMRHEAEEKRKREEAAARNALEEARRHALALAREKEELEKQQQLHYELHMEATGLKQSQGISRPWVYSYFQHPYLKVRDDD